MHRNSAGRRSSTNPVRISILDRENKSLTRNDQRKTQTLKSKGVSTVETSHIPRSRFRSSSCDRAGSLGRISHLKTTGKTPLRQPTTPVTPSFRPNLANTGLTASSSRFQTTIGRSPSGDRISSIGAKGPRKDTRPLMDKTYQTSLLYKIDNFICMNQHSMMLNSNGSFKPVTLKMFVEISDFLFKFFDVRRHLTLMNYVDELPKYAKKLHYPGTITKSWLKTANAMHSWPHVLGWIGWLVEACQVREFAFQKYQLETLPFMGTEQQAQNSRMEFLTLIESYKAWNDENNDEEAQLLKRFLQDTLIQQSATEEDIDQARKELEVETLNLQVIEQESQVIDEQVEQLKGQLSSLHAKEAKQLNDIKTKEDYIKKISAETNQLNAERDVLNEQVRIGNIQHEKLISIVKDQPMSKTEKEKIVTKCTEIQNYIHEFDEYLKDYQKKLYTLDIKLASSSNNLNKAILAYNKELFMHIDNDVGMNFDELKLPEKGLLNPQIMDVLEEKAALTKTFKELLVKRCNEMKSLIRSDTVKLEKLQEEVKSLPDENKLKQEKSNVSKMKIDVKNEKVKLTKQVEDLKNEIEKIQHIMPDIQAIELEIQEAKDKLDAVTRRKTYLEQSAKQFFNEFYEILSEHKNELHDILIK